MNDANPADGAGGPGRTRRRRAAADPAPGISALDFNLTANVNYLLRRAHARADSLFNQVMADTGVTPRQAALLFAVGAAPGCSLTELAKTTGIDRGTIAEMVPRLVRRGLLLQTQASDDARAKSLSCTEAGLNAFRFVSERTPELRTDVLRPLPTEYHELFVKMLSLLVEVEVEVRTKTGTGVVDPGGSTRSKG